MTAERRHPRLHEVFTCVLLFLFPCHLLGFLASPRCHHAHKSIHSLQITSSDSSLSKSTASLVPYCHNKQQRLTMMNTTTAEERRALFCRQASCRDLFLGSKDTMEMDVMPTAPTSFHDETRLTGHISNSDFRQGYQRTQTAFDWSAHQTSSMRQISHLQPQHQHSFQRLTYKRAAMSYDEVLETKRRRLQDL